MNLDEEYTIPYEGNRYCGPAALAYLMRSSPTDAAKLLREIPIPMYDDDEVPIPQAPRGNGLVDWKG